ncbi:hypothetical protein ACFSMW_01210 [Virgibacillus halophilus]|uniref:Uncharacterized protein n=1 Tax=Tigheibacillus halophilus TaxID=361280 RepID=A0ABU5CBI8_9BACI|nr:hypothetical protein [Virgibacillus halophilus]
MGNLKRNLLFAILFSFLAIGQMQQVNISQEMDIYDNPSVSAYHGGIVTNAIQMNAHSNLPAHQPDLLHFPPRAVWSGIRKADFDSTRGYVPNVPPIDTTGFLSARKYQSDYLS